MAQPLEGDDFAPGLRVRVGGDDVCNVLDVVEDMPNTNALCTLAMALVQCAWGSSKQDASGQRVPLTHEELKALLADLTSGMVDLAAKSDLWGPGPT
jgi:hypothetical protein